MFGRFKKPYLAMEKLLQHEGANNIKM
jgi:hypothetical protein